MLRNFLRTPIFRHIAMLIAIPLLLSSTGYALFAQQLSVSATATSPAYTSSQNLSVSYTKDVAAAGQNWLYTVAVTIKNNSTRDTTGWQSAFSLPTDYANISCSDATCTQTDDTNTAVNTGSNGAIAAGGMLTYTFSFTSLSQTYRFTAIDVSGTLATAYEPVSGLTVIAVAGTRTESNGWYIWPYTFTVTNASGQDLDGWRILAPWDTSSNQVAGMPGAVNYIELAHQLTILSTQAIAHNTSFQFTADLSSTSPAYVLSGYSVDGQL
jgi:hypothetical protein